MFWKSVEYVGLAAFILIVPRLMGPELYGRFALLFSLIGLLMLVIGLGALSIFGRFIPQYEAQGEKSKIQALFVELFFVRLFKTNLRQLRSTYHHANVQSLCTACDDMLNAADEGWF